MKTRTTTTPALPPAPTDQRPVCTKCGGRNIPFAAIARDAGHRGEAIAAARAFLEASGRDTPGRDAPHAWCAWHRIAWLSVLRAAAIDAGHGDGDAPRWRGMSTAALAAELDELTAPPAAI